jgi:hypothetical protein
MLLIVEYCVCIHKYEQLGKAAHAQGRHLTPFMQS